MWRAIIYGCIPVTYFRAVELPFMRRLGIDYGQFSVNIQPDDFDTTQVRIAAPCCCGGVAARLQTAEHFGACSSCHACQLCIKLLRHAAGAPGARVPARRYADGRFILIESHDGHAA